MAHEDDPFSTSDNDLPEDLNADERKIGQRVSTTGKLIVAAVVGLLGVTGYFLVKQAREDSENHEQGTAGRTELGRIVDNQNLSEADKARQARELYARNPSPEARMSARRVLAGMHDPEAVPLLIEGLAHEGHERQQAALGLAEIGAPAANSAKDALMAALPTSGEVDKPSVVWALVVLGDERAWDTIVQLLASRDLQKVRNLDDPPREIFDPTLVARMAGPTRLQHLAAENRPQPTDAPDVRANKLTLRRFAALSLGEIASPDLYETLETLAHDTDTDVARNASIGLGRTGDPRAGATITGFIDAHPDERDAVLNALTQNAGAPALATVIHASTNVDVRGTAVRLLRELEDPGAGNAFDEVLHTVPADATDDKLKKMRANAIFGLANIGDPRAADGLMELAMRPLAPNAHVDPNVDQEAKLALDALRKIPGACARVKTQLLALLPRADFMRSQVLLALGETGDAALGAQAATFLADPNAQEGAAVAVCKLRYASGVARVRSDMRRPPNVHMNEQTAQNEELFIKRRNAVNAIAWTRDPAVAADLLRIIEDPQDDPRIREDAGFSLATVADEHVAADLLTRALDATKPAGVRLSYLDALRVRATPAMANRLVEAYVKPGTPVELMRAAAVVGGFAGDASTSALLVPMLAATDANVQLNAALALTLCGDTAGGHALVHAVATNHELGELLASTFVTRSATGPAGAAVANEPAFLMPLTDAMFTDGRIARRIGVAAMLEHGEANQHFEWAMSALVMRVRNGWDNPLGIGPHEARARLRELARGTDATVRDAALVLFQRLNDRGSLLALRRGEGAPAEAARRTLRGMNATGH